ncbi:hypothetical protein H0H92_008467 [Tricholoma furcatifolium]|nr:hypothetical protein H0H92_008467 [Tricholoma furcatifolium]
MASLYMSVLSNFEELRVQDYLHAYTTTGRPPQPCPPLPADPAARIAAGLPPIFVPLSESDFVAIKHPNELPNAQEFSPTPTEQDTASLQSISAMPAFQFFSHDELRIYAYMAGNILSPPPIAMSPFTANVTAPAAPPHTTAPGAEQLLALTTQPAYSAHSFEELRIAYLQSGREVSSAEIIASAQLPPHLSTTTTTAAGTGTRLATPTPTRLF